MPADPTDTAPPTTRPNPPALAATVAAAIALAEATLSEGFCPFCSGRLSSLSEYDIERTRSWYAPPGAACLSCERVVGRYPEGGVYGSTLHHLDAPLPPRVEVRNAI